MTIKIGSTVEPKSKAGLWLADVPVDGISEQVRKEVVVFHGAGIVLAIHTSVIDYSTWPTVLDDDGIVGFNHNDIGKVIYQNCLVECADGNGWAGEGALVVIYQPVVPIPE